MNEKTPEQVYSETPETIKRLAQKVLKIERDNITQTPNQGIVDNLIMIFREDVKNETN